jgi:hypothetical protein
MTGDVGNCSVPKDGNWHVITVQNSIVIPSSIRFIELTS